MAERGQPQSQWIDIAAQFPASLSKDASSEAIKDGQTPDAYGMGSDKPGLLYVEPTVPAGTVWNGITTVTAPSNAPVTATWRFCHNRLFGFAATGTTLYYGAYGYLTSHVLQGLGYVPCDSQESGNIVQVVPFGSNIAVFKADALYVIKNADSPSGSFESEYVKQSSGLPVAGNVIAMDGVLYWANTYGVFAYDGNQIVELTTPIRNNLGAFASGQITSLTADFAQKQIIGLNGAATKFIIVPGQNVELYDYSTTGFRFTTRTITGADTEPLLVDKVAFVYQYSGDIATINFDVKISDTWKTESQLKIRPADAQGNGRIEVSLMNALACRKFAMRITAMSASLYISRIQAHVKSGGVLGYSNK
jgi:hypothetical protein